jgi:hypothetical protein
MTTHIFVTDKDARGKRLTPPEGDLLLSPDARTAFAFQMRGEAFTYERGPGGRYLPKPVDLPRVEAAGMNTPGVHQQWVQNGLLATVDAAFNSHYKLMLSPDDLWLTIAQGFALHVDANAETLRRRFVAHEGKAELKVRRDEFVKGAPNNDWMGAFSEFSDQIAGYIGKTRDLIVSNFSTTGPIERAASEIVLMDAMKNYFEYTMQTCCGIPEIYLLGTTADWKSIRARAAVLSEYDLEWWTTPLCKVLDKIVAATEGEEDPEFWKSIYHRGGGSGGPYVNGWIQNFFPYLKSRGAEFKTPNKDLSSVQRRIHGPTLSSIPPSLSKVDFKWEYLNSTYEMQFVAGILGISQDPETKALRPSIGWAVKDK